MRITLGILLIAVGIIGAYFILSGKALSTVPTPPATGPGGSKETPPTNPSQKVPGGTIYGSGGDMYASSGGMR